MRVRLRYSKLGKVRFLSHRDVARAWERAWRRSGIPLRYTEGFSPRPKVHFGLALSTGFESLGEYLDVDVPDDAELEPETLPERLTPLLPEGIDVQAAVVLPPRSTSLQEAVVACRWELEVSGATEDELRSAVDRLLAAQVVEITRERKGKTTTDDIRSYVLSLDVRGPGLRGTRLDAELATQPRALRPAELVEALIPTADTPPPTLVSALRTHQWTSPHGARQEPIPLPATWAPHAGARAS